MMDNRSFSKSDDSFGSQFLITQALSESPQSTTELVDKQHDADVTPHADAPISFDKPVYRNPETHDEVPEFHVAGAEDGCGEVGWQRGEADQEDDPEAAVAGEPCQGAVVEVCAFELFGAASERVHEGVPCADCTSVSV